MRRFAYAILFAYAISSAASAQEPPPLTAEEQRQAEEAMRTAAGISGVMLAAVALGGLLFLAMMFGPVVIAVLRGHPDVVAITAVSVLFGWTCLGWMVALVWSLKAFDARADR